MIFAYFLILSGEASSGPLGGSVVVQIRLVDSWVAEAGETLVARNFTAQLLSPLDREETAEYIRSRLLNAGAEEEILLGTARASR